MGFYQPAQTIIDARKHGVEIRPVDINFSDWDNKLEADDSEETVDRTKAKYCGLRLGFRK